MNDRAVKIVDDELEYPEPCPILKANIRVMVRVYKDIQLEEEILRLARLVVRSTKQSIRERLLDD